MVLAWRTTSARESELDAPRPGKERAEAVLVSRSATSITLQVFLRPAVPGGDDATGVLFSPAQGVKRGGPPGMLPKNAEASRNGANAREIEKFYRASVKHADTRGSGPVLTRTTQLVADRSAIATSDTEKAEQMIAFTDSRDDAADLAAGLEVHHFRDLVRQLLFKALQPRESITSEMLGELVTKSRSGVELSESEAAIVEKREKAPGKILGKRHGSFSAGNGRRGGTGSPCRARCQRLVLPSRLAESRDKPRRRAGFPWGSTPAGPKVSLAKYPGKDGN